MHFDRPNEAIYEHKLIKLFCDIIIASQRITLVVADFV